MSATAPAFGICTIDTGFHRPDFDAAYLIAENGRGAFVDSGTSHSLPRHLAALAAARLDPADVDWVILTHAHLDHAGGAGALLRELPNARLLAHPRCAPHMIDPRKLIAGATAVYGAEEIARSYGEIVPVDASRVDIAEDDHVIELAGRPLRCIDTPGHARHHLCLWDEASRGWFTGDTFGLSYREFDGPRGPFALPTTTPVQFEPDALHASIDRLLSFDPRRAFLTHYGEVTELVRMAADLHAAIDAMVAMARELADAPDRHRRLVAALTAHTQERVREHGCVLDAAKAQTLLAMDMELNAQGLEVWLQRSA